MARYDLKKYSGQHFIKVNDVRDEPLRETIVGVREGAYGKLELILESGDILSLNATNTEILMDAYGRNSDHLVAKEIEMKLGMTKFKGEDTETVVVVPISPPIKKKETKEASGKPAPSMDDEIPF